MRLGPGRKRTGGTALDRPQDELASTGIEGLDTVLNGGFPRGTLTLLAGAPGAGKTTAALQFLLAGTERGEKGLFFSAAQTSNELQRMAAAHGLDLSRMLVHSPAIGADGGARQYVVETRESDLDALLEELYRTLQEVEPDLFVFDSLLELRLLASDLMAYRREVLALRRYLAARQITSMLIDHLHDLESDRQIEGIAHTAIRLEGYVPPIGITHRRAQVTKMRGRAYTEGYHDFRIRKGGIEIFPRIVPATLEASGTQGQLATGRDALDHVLGGGLEFGTTTLIAGQSGTGKSTLSTLFATAAATQGINAALFLFEERPEVYRERSDSIGLGLSEAERSGRVALEHFDPAEISPGEFCQQVVRQVERLGARVVVLDSLSGYLNALPHRDNVITHLQTLLQFLARRGVLVVVTVAQHGLLGEPPRTDLDTSYLADATILLRHYAAGSVIRRSLAVLKKRHSSHESRLQEFVIRPGAVEIGELSEAEAQLSAKAPLAGH